MERIEVYAYRLGFRVSRNGELISFTGRKRQCLLHPKGYKCISLRVKIEDKSVYKLLFVHRLQAYQKFGENLFKPGIVVRHLNGNPTDNSFDNIEIGTESDNWMDIPKEKRIERARNASRMSPKRYSRDKISMIKADRASGMSYNKLMKKYGISSKGTISYICNHEYVF